MKIKKRRIVFKLLVMLFIVLVIVIYNREDYRFIIANTIEKISENVEVEEVQFRKEDLQVIPLKEIKESYKIEYNDSLNLINKEFPISGSDKERVVNYKDTDLKMKKFLVDPYKKLSKAVKEKTGEDLLIMSSFRTREEQKIIASQDSKKAATPGSSEHEKGIALDVYVKFFAGKGFLKTEAGQFVNKNSWKYRFIIRYPIDKKTVTGVPFEPWHIRYVGKPHAEIIYKNNLALEEYIDSLEKDKFYKFDGHIISRQSDDILTFPRDLKEVVVSPDNMGNFIITGILED